MTIYKPNPTYYRVEWNQSSPTDYTGLSGTQAGGLDSIGPLDYNSQVSITGNVSIAGTPLSTGNTMVVNGQAISFLGTDTLTDIITTINMYRVTTNVIAHNDIAPTFITLCNAAGYEAEPISLAEGTGALSKLGFTAGVYKNFPNVMGISWTNMTNNDNVSLNGVTVTFTTAGGLDRAGVAETINSMTYLTHVVALPAAGNIQLSSTSAQPIVVAGPAATKLGFPAGVYAGSPATLPLSTSKSYANLRWQQVINQLELDATPFVVTDLFGTGNYDGSTELDTFSFTVGYERPDQVVTVARIGEPNAGTLLTGTAAIKRAVARGLAATYNGNINQFDPLSEVRNGIAIRPNQIRVTNLTVTGIDTDISLLEGNITVTMIVLE